MPAAKPHPRGALAGASRRRPLNPHRPQAVVSKIRAARPACLALLVASLVSGCGLLPPQRGDVTVEHQALDCKPVENIVGAEDATVHAETGFAYVSSADRRAVLNGDDAKRDGIVGRIYRLDLGQDKPAMWDITPEGLSADGFYPHGISLLTRPAGGALLFVVAHGAERKAGTTAKWAPRGTRSTVKIFEIAPGASGAAKMTHLATIDDPALISPNDVAAIDERQFFVTNEHGTSGKVESALRDVLGLNNGNLVYFDGEKFHSVLDLPWANGVQADLARRRLYVASSSRGTITTLAWEDTRRSAMALAGTSPLPLDTGVDNIEIDPTTGDLLVAAHPSALELAALRFRWFGREAAPTQAIAVRRLGMNGAPDPRGAREILRQDGDERHAGQIAGASVAASYVIPQTGRRRLLLGSIFSDRMLVCDEPAGR